MRRLFLVLVLLTPSALNAQTPAAARLALQKGNYAEAEELFEELVKEPKTAAVAAIGLSRAREAQGKYDDALVAVETALKMEAANADLLARRAELLFQRGRWDEAKKTAMAALKKSPDHLLARWIDAQIIRDSGDWPKAAEAFRWFVKYFNKRSDADMEITDPEELLLVGYANLEYARYYHVDSEYESVLEHLFGAAIKNDKRFWQAEYASGRLFSEKHNKKDASTRFDRALKLNPRAAEVFASRAETAYQQFEMKDADFLAGEALGINPNLPEALRVKAAIHLFSGEHDAAMKLLEKARRINPRDESTLAQFAAVLHAQKREKEFDAVLAEVEKFNPKAWRFNVELGSHLDSRKLFYDSGKYFKRAIELEPNMPEGYEGLGMLEMRLGKETAARKSLTDAFDADPFNVRVSNSLKVLDHLARYETIKTPHYLVRYDPKNDEALARFVVHYLEKLHVELEKKFDFHPKEPYLIEIFNKHEMFSGRVTALPDLHTIGACTGRMFAMVSTHDKSKVINKPFNWNRVLRHEVVHLFNLDQTKFQIPHWFTEGLAVMLEGKTTPPRWNYILADKLRENDLLNLDNILLGFVRPRTPDQWQQAYLQSELYVQYLIKTHGEEAVGRLLAAFAEGLDTDGALPKAIKVSKADFEKGYRAFIVDRVKNMKLPPQPPEKTLKELKEERKKNPEDPDIIAQLAEKHYQTGDGKIALELANEALRLKLNHPLAAYVKAAVLLGDKKTDLALAVLAASVAEHPDEPKGLKLLGKAQFETKNFPDAAATLERGRKLEPFEPYWLVQLAKVYVQTKDEEKLMDVLKSVAEHDPDDLNSRTKLAEYYDRNKMWPEAERYALGALEVDVKSATAQTILLRALEEQNKNDERALYQKLLQGE
jgi:tetratricopeptide (TPR) repeat protein